MRVDCNVVNDWPNLRILGSRQERREKGVREGVKDPGPAAGRGP